MLPFFNRRIPLVLLIPFLLILIPLVFFLYLTIEDSVNPRGQKRLYYWVKLGLPRNEKIVSLLKTKVKELDDEILPTMYRFCKDQKTLDPSQGFWCGVTGKLTSAETYEDEIGPWKVESGVGQEYTVFIQPSTWFYFRHKYYSEKEDTWKENKIITSSIDFSVNDVVAVIWDCSTSDPNEMFLDKEKVKQEFLSVNAKSISKPEPEDQIK